MRLECETLRTERIAHRDQSSAINSSEATRVTDRCLLIDGLDSCADFLQIFRTLSARASLSIAATFDGVSSMHDPDQLLGTVIDNRYRLSEFIGNGSYGSVF